MTISVGVAGLLRSRDGGHAERQREQRRDDGPVSHGLFLEKGCGSWLRRPLHQGVKTPDAGVTVVTGGASQSLLDPQSDGPVSEASVRRRSGPARRAVRQWAGERELIVSAPTTRY